MMDSNAARTLLAIVLSMAVLLVWQVFFAPKPVPRPHAPDAAATAAAQDGGAAPARPAEAKAEGAGTAPAEKQAEEKKPPKPRADEKLFAVETDLWQAVFTDRGGALKSFKLKKYRVATKDPRPVDLVIPPKADDLLPLTSSFSKASFAFDPTETFEAASQTPESITFRHSGGGVTVERTYTFKKGEYVLGLSTTVANRGDAKIAGKPVIAWGEQAPAAAASSSSWLFPAGPEDAHVPSCLVNDSVEKLKAPSKENPAPREFFEGRVMWAGADSRYFLAAIVPQTAGRTGCEIRAETGGAFTASVMYPELEIPPGESRNFAYRIFIGPKDYGRLKELQSGLDRSVDYGWLSVLCVPMLWLLRLFSSIVGNYGVAIIFLTILVKLASLPLTQKSYKAMQEMARLKPMIDELQKKHKDDRQKLNEQMMRLYQQHGISPLSGCLPMLLQMPIWIALYRMLYGAVELYQAPFIRGWTDNLAEKDPTYVLPIVLGAGMFVQQKITPTTMDSAQAKVMLYFMPAFFTLIMLSLPSGLTLYIFVNTILSLVHQVYNNRRAGVPPFGGTASKPA